MTVACFKDKKIISITEKKKEREATQFNGRRLYKAIAENRKMWPMQEVRTYSCGSSMGWQQVWCLILCQPDWPQGTHIKHCCLWRYFPTRSSFGLSDSVKWIAVPRESELRAWLEQEMKKEGIFFLRFTFCLTAWAETSHLLLPSNWDLQPQSLWYAGF